MPDGTIPSPASTTPPAPAAPAAGAAPAVPAAAPTPPSCDCGPLAPRPGEQPIPMGTSADSILSQIQLECDNATGVFFFRFKSQLYLRVVKVD